MALLSIKRGKMKRVIPKIARMINTKSTLLSPFVTITITFRRAKSRKAAFHSNQFPNPFPAPHVKILLTDEVPNHRFVELGLALTYLWEMLVAFQHRQSKGRGEVPRPQGGASRLGNFILYCAP